MTLSGQPKSFQLDRRFLRRLLVCYGFFIVYVSFIPFLFNLDPNFVHWRLDVFLSRSLYRGITRWSWSDIISNIFLYFPLGLLWSGSLRADRWLARSSITPLVIGMFGLFVGLTIELGQTLSPYRSPSMLDAICNGLGTFLGAIAGFFLFRALAGSFGENVVWLVRHRPSLIVLGVLLIVLVVDSYYPFYLVFDAPTIYWFDLRRIVSSYYWPAFPSTWIDLFIEKGTLFAALGFVIFRTQQQAKRERPALSAWFRASIAALAIESGKIFFAGPIFQPANILMSSIGAFCGVTIVPALECLAPIRRRPQVALLAVVLGLLCYLELWPFDWIYAVELPTKISQIEWLPLASYYASMPQAALFDLAKKLTLALPVGFLAEAASPIRGEHRRTCYTTAFGAFVGVLLEVCQLAVRSRLASITAVLIFTFGSWVGASAFEWSASKRISKDTTQVPSE